MVNKGRGKELRLQTERREQVAKLVLRGLTQREIVRGLEAQGHVNPKTGRAWSLAIINRDLKALKAEWQARAAADIDHWRGELIARLDALYRRAWADGDLTSALKVIAQQRAMLGADAPIGGEGAVLLADGRGLRGLLAAAAVEEGGA